MSYITQRTERCGGFVVKNTNKPPPSTRTEGRLKKFDSCQDARAWNPSPTIRSVYLLDYVNASRCFSEANIRAGQANKSIATFKDEGTNVNLGTEKNIGTRKVIAANKNIGTPGRTCHDQQSGNQGGKVNTYKSVEICTDGWKSTGSGPSKKICVGLKPCKTTFTFSDPSKQSATHNDVATYINGNVMPYMNVKPCMDPVAFLDVKPTMTVSEPGREYTTSKTVCTTKNQRVSNRTYINDLESRFDGALKENICLRKKMAGYRRKLRKQYTKRDSYDDICNFNVPSEFNRLQERLLARRLTSKEKIETYEQQLNILKSHCKYLQSHKMRGKPRGGNDSFTSASTLSPSDNTDSTCDDGSLHGIVAELQLQVSSLRPVKKERDELRNETKRLNDQIKSIDSHYNAELESLLTVLSSTQSENDTLSEENSLTRSSISTLCKERDFLLRKIHQHQCQEMESDDSENVLSCHVKNLTEQRDTYKDRLEGLQGLYRIREEQLRSAECTILDQMRTIRSLNIALRGTPVEKSIAGRHSDVCYSKSEVANLKSMSNQESTKSLPIGSMKNKINNGHNKVQANNLMDIGAPDAASIITRGSEVLGSGNIEIDEIQQNNKNQNQINEESIISQTQINEDLSTQNETDSTAVCIHVQVQKGPIATQTKISTENTCTEMRLCQMDHVKATLLQSKSAVTALIKHIKEENEVKRKTSTQRCVCGD